ncbi:hypothetical protein D3C81_1140810 [compost metagenome]
MHAAGILGDVAADRTGDLRGWIWRVIQAERRRCLGDRQIAHPRLNPRGARGRVDVQDIIEARHHQQQALFQRQGAAGQPGAGTTGNHRDVFLMAEFEQGLHLLNSSGQGDQHRRGAVGGETVAFVGFEFFLAPQNVEIWQRLLQ